MGKTAKYLATKVSDGIDPKFFNQVAQIAHFGMMFFVMAVCVGVGGKLGHQWIGMLVGTTIDWCYGVWHEFFWDPVHENAETRGSDMEDFLFLELGNVVGMLYFWWVL